MNETNIMELSAKDVIRIFLELIGLTPNLDEWNEKHLADNPPRYYRLRQLKILFDIYSLGNFIDFVEGEFINNRPVAQFKDLIKKANKFEIEYLSERHLIHYNEINDLNPGVLQSLFNYLLLYRIKLSDVIEYNDGVIECNSLFRFAYFKVQHFNELIIKEIDSIDDILCFVISPSGKTFSLNELVTKYGFPDVDLNKIDEDWT